MSICKRIICGLLSVGMCLMLVTPALAASAFRDVPANYWAAEEIQEAVEDGIVNGYTDGTFRPAASVTYAHFSAFLARAFYPDHIREATHYEDWYAPYFEIVYEYNLASGTQIASGFWNSFANLPINRYDMAQMMYNIIQFSVNTASDTAENDIGDWNSIPTGYRDAVSVCYALGLLNGQADGNFGGANSMNRAQACVVIHRMNQYIDGVSGNDGENPAISVGTLANGKAPTEENVLELLAELKEKYPNESRYDPYNPPYQLNVPPHYLGTECAKLAFMLSDEIFGSLPLRKTTVSQIRPGDLIQSPTHWSVALVGYGDIVTSDGNVVIKTVDGGPAGIVYWDDTSTTDGTYASWLTYNNVVVWTRYPTDSSGPAERPENPSGQNDVTTGQTESQEIRCANCGYLMQAAGSNVFDANSNPPVFDCCDQCHNYYVCGQCINCAAFRNHVATCQG
ncbi:MAG: S-layer homology domain-containing protein [Oscillospiraceae bacterium]|nr:S-layer homology domain-containing protein [Oscillospiraceae bacterium]